MVSNAMNMTSTDEYDDDENFFDGDTLPFEEEDSDKHGYCESCDQDYDGECPENSPDCPINFKAEDEDDEEDDIDDEDDSDFDDIDDIDEIVGYDEEAEKLIEEEEEIPPEDLVDEEEVEEEEEVVEEEDVDSVDDEEDDDYLYQK